MEKFNQIQKSLEAIQEDINDIRTLNKESKQIIKQMIKEIDEKIEELNPDERT